MKSQEDFRRPYRVFITDNEDHVVFGINHFDGSIEYRVWRINANRELEAVNERDLAMPLSTYVSRLW